MVLKKSFLEEFWDQTNIFLNSRRSGSVHKNDIKRNLHTCTCTFHSNITLIKCVYSESFNISVHIKKKSHTRM